MTSFDDRPGRRRRMAVRLVTLLAIAGALPVLAADRQRPGGDRARPQQHWVATWGTAQQQFRAAAPAARGQSPGSPAAASGAAGSAAAPAPAAPAQPPPPPPSSSVPGQAPPARRFGIPPSIPGLSNQTVRMIVRTSIGGRTLRVRLSNALGAPAIALGAAHVAIRSKGSSIVAGSDRALTFSGKPAAMLFAGATLVSDPVDLQVPPVTELAVSLYLPGDTGPPTSHTFALHPTYVSSQGDRTAAADVDDAARTTESYYWLTGIDVLAPADAGTLVTFGDSITDGDQSTPGSNGAWPSVLAERLQASPKTRNIGIVNAGISGNRLLGDNTSGLARLLRDALSVPGVKWLTLLEGINDITAGSRAGAGAPNAIAAADLIAAYRQVIALGHLHGVKVIGCTLTPFGGSPVFNEYGERVRSDVNAWIRTGGEFDAVIDFDAATRDRTDPRRFSAGADSPDLLHPANPGYRLMANAVDLSMFTRR